VFVAASTRCFADVTFDVACNQISDLDYDKVELWLSEDSDHLNAAETAAGPERFVAHYREMTRLTPIALSIDGNIDAHTLAGLSKVAKLLRVTQITVPASPIGTPFNTEIDRLREYIVVTGQDGVRLSLKTETGHLTEDPHTAVELCQSVAGLGLTLDPSYYICGPNRGKSYDQVFPYVYHVQLRDTTPEELQVQVGLGDVGYNRVITQLRREEYNLALSVELIPSLARDTDRALEMRKLRMLLDSLL
jgi:sugar phosphate isomerase/epimerase